MSVRLCCGSQRKDVQEPSRPTQFIPVAHFREGVKQLWRQHRGNPFQNHLNSRGGEGKSFKTEGHGVRARPLIGRFRGMGSVLNQEVSRCQFLCSY